VLARMMTVADTLALGALVSERATRMIVLPRDEKTRAKRLSIGMGDRCRNIIIWVVD
jgi:hypothetical protein